MLAFLPEPDLETWLADTTRLDPVTPNTISDKQVLRQELLVIRGRGYATDNEENMLTICCIAAPIFDVSQRVIAAVSVAGPNTRMPQPLVDSEISEHVIHVARSLCVKMEWTTLLNKLV
jgi:DNA-binding IclR family transcriptional regulator